MIQDYSTCELFTTILRFVVWGDMSKHPLPPNASYARCRVDRVGYRNVVLIDGNAKKKRDLYVNLSDVSLFRYSKDIPGFGISRKASSKNKVSFKVNRPPRSTYAAEVPRQTAIAGTFVAVSFY